MKKVRRKKINFKKIFWVLLVLVIGVLFFLIYFVPNIGETFQKTTIARYNTIQILDEADCYIVRDETVYYSGAEGSIKYLADEGQKIKKGSDIVRVNLEKVDESVNSKLEIINQKIEQADAGTFFENDLEVIDDLIKKEVDLLIKKKEEGNLSETKSIQERIKMLTDKKNIIINNTGIKSGNINFLKEERQELQSVLDRATVSYKNEKAGVVSYYVDGYEEVFTHDKMYLLNKESLDKENIQAENTERDYVFKGEPLFKVINSSTWYAVLWVDLDKIDNYKKGNKIVLNFENGQTQGIVYDIIIEKNNAMILVEINRMVEDLSKIRRGHVDLIVADYSGLEIYTDSIVDVNGQLGVYVVNIGGEYSFRPIKIIGSDKDKTIVVNAKFQVQTENGVEDIKTITLYDEILRNAEKKGIKADEDET
ncbi:MAG: HlyD family efflux transporter periplasmic adaptor subunit [Peptostreptococcales bacterium]